MDHHVLIGLGTIVVLGIAAQWLAWRLRLPSILVLLLVGFVAGPVTGFLHPDELFGDLLSPAVSISVALILFEGGLSLKWHELNEVGTVVRRLITVGVVITWVLSAAAAYWLLGLDAQLSLLLGAILTVTGPTVVIPLLRDIRAVGRVRAVLRWEGILIDPIGVMLAVLVFEAIVIADQQQAAIEVVSGLLSTLAVGLILGAGLAVLLTALLRRYWIPDYLQNPVVVMAVVGGFVLSDLIQPEAGLLTATVMGVVMANQRATPIKHILEFKENIGVMLISNLFVLLAARLELDALADLGLEVILFVAFLILVVRPLVVFVASIGSELSLREKLFVSWLAPRGIVAAASSSLFALELNRAGHENAEILIPLVFTVIVFTVAIYGLTARPLARYLGISQGAPQGLLIVGAHDWSRRIAETIQSLEYRVLLVDSNWLHVQQARMQGLDVVFGNILSEDEDELDLTGIGRLLALTQNDEVNSLAALHYREIFGRSEVYQLPCRPSVRSDAVPLHMRGRLLFGEEYTFERLSNLFAAGATLKVTALTEEFTYEDFRRYYNGKATPLFIKTEQNELLVLATDVTPVPRVGQSIVSVVLPEESEQESDGAIVVGAT
ncbi:MAG: sodium:proton antiporter [Anaerolineae bacterium]